MSGNITRKHLRRLLSVARDGLRPCRPTAYYRNDEYMTQTKDAEIRRVIGGAVQHREDFVVFCGPGDDPMWPSSS